MGNTNIKDEDTFDHDILIEDLVNNKFIEEFAEICLLEKYLHFSDADFDKKFNEHLSEGLKNNIHERTDLHHLLFCAYLLIYKVNNQKNRIMH